MKVVGTQRHRVVHLPGKKPTARIWPSYSLFGIVAIFIGLVFALPALAQTCGGTVKCRCGDTLIADRTLANDPIVQTACPGDGLTIGASGITLDLKTKAIKGSGQGVGVLVADGVKNASIIGRPPARIQGFGTGIKISSGASHVTVSGVQAYYHRGDGILVEGDYNRVINSPGRHNGNNGHAVMNGDHNVITGANNEYNGDNGFFVQGNFNELIANKASENDKSRQGQGIGIAVIGHSNIIRLSQLTHNNTHGIVVAGNDNFLEGNSTNKHKFDGIVVNGNNTVLINNSATNTKNATTQNLGIFVEGDGNAFASSGNVSNDDVCSIYGVTGQGVCAKTQCSEAGTCTAGP